MCMQCKLDDYMKPLSRENLSSQIGHFPFAGNVVVEAVGSLKMSALPPRITADVVIGDSGSVRRRLFNYTTTYICIYR